MKKLENHIQNRFCLTAVTSQHVGTLTKYCLDSSKKKYIKNDNTLVSLCLRRRHSHDNKGWLKIKASMLSVKREEKRDLKKKSTQGMVSSQRNRYTHLREL